MPFSPTQEDYLEAIWDLTTRHGYVRVKDVATALGVNSPSVSKMIEKLHKDGIVERRRYMGFRMTPDGYQRGQKLHERRTIIKEFLESMELDSSDTVHQTVEGVEHYISDEVLNNMRHLLKFIQLHPEWWDQYRNWRKFEDVGMNS
ncbi:metal-dependent transcriptional regulator [Alicyclobacillus fastidiosus]|uniref:Manganese transport regulator n=1 Tax=Alicyclobacillus fastidiosus TaxID=392011 RepID=A0ABY6ZME9_9BACL|nr:metal-dependent transcriptional regulator [Alicyclobacillus fastidiosus]WAH44027.1 metal-dependent transcriptional regulator [Alicyclobacillus fastidiosus]GMA60315.1 transcriptional regulator MntR [Alicyclobacillus fastidiosus]